MTDPAISGDTSQMLPPLAQSWSTKELLAVTITPPPSHTDDSSPVAHASSTNNARYAAIVLSSLVPVTEVMIASFRDHIDSMNIRWRSSLAIDRRGYDVRTEADVVTFLQNAGICAGWQVALEMVPSDRHYDLITTQEFSMKARFPVVR